MMDVICTYVHENRTMKPVELVLRKGGGKIKENVVSTYVNDTMNSPCTTNLGL
jgi:hypothetical protein